MPTYEPLQRRSFFIGVSRRKQVLVLLAIAGCSILSFLYWRQLFVSYPTFNVYSRNHNLEGELDTLKDTLKDTLEDALEDTLGNTLSTGSSEPKWTWICQNNTCIRMSETTNLTQQSLATCNMLCSSSQLWPQPTGPTSLATRALPVAANRFILTIDASPSDEVSQYLREAFDLLKSDISILERESSEKNDHLIKHSVTIHVNVNGDADPKLRLDTDESYKLSLGVSSNREFTANITAHSFCGARHAFETLSQLIWMDTTIGSLLILTKASVEDAPRFHYRGLLLDTARNFFPVKDLLRTIDAMAANKLNTFHWHATDSQSFPLVFASAPYLTKHGAYGQLAVYTREDIRAVVHRARLRGIRVLIEVDAPAHVGSAFGFGPSQNLGDLAYCIDKDPWNSYCGEPPCGQLNPLNPNVYKILQNIYAEIIELTGVKDVFHLGGDEVNINCWQKNIQRQNAKNLWLNFTMTTLNALQRANDGILPKLTLIWSSSLTEASFLQYLDSSKITIQLWGSSEWPSEINVLNKGFRSVLSHVNAWYMDCGHGSWRDDSFGHCPPYRQWDLFYNHRPWKVATDAWRVEGGAACHWTETLGPSGLDAALWPRGAAIAERLWSDPIEVDIADVHFRLDTQRSRLLAKGIGATPIWPGHWCSQNPGSCLM